MPCGEGVTPEQMVENDGPDHGRSRRSDTGDRCVLACHRARGCSHHAIAAALGQSL